MSFTRPKTIILPPPGIRRKRLRFFQTFIKSRFEWDKMENLVQLAVYLMSLMIDQLFEEGVMLNTETFLADIAEHHPKLYEVVKNNMYVFDEACIQLSRVCKEI